VYPGPRLRRSPNGIDATAQVKTPHPETIVISLSVNIDDENQEAMVKAGATLLMSKEAAIDQLYETIHAAPHDHSMHYSNSSILTPRRRKRPYGVLLSPHYS